VDPLPVDVLTVDTALRHHARRTPREAALTFAGRRYSYRELDSAVDRVSDALYRLGLRRGDRFALAAGNSDRFVIALLAALRAGAIVVPMNPAGTPRELDYLLTDSGAAILAVDAAADTAPADLSRQTAGGTLRAVTDLDTLVTNADTAAGEHPPIADGRDVRPPCDDDDALILYTSGTTGRPRGALFDHRRTLAAARAVIGACGLRATDRLLIAAPLSHAAALGVLLIPTVVRGAEAVILPRFDAEEVIATIAARRISVFFGVPTMYQLLLGETALTPADLASWRTALFGGSAMPVATIEAMRRALPDLGLLQLCGQTEAGPGGIYSSPAQVDARPGASGHQALPGSEIRVVAADGTDVGAGGVGEMLIRAGSVMKGYWRNPTATAEVLKGGWLRTGDVVRVDDDGSLTLIDRLRDMIVTGGRNVYSAEVERVIMTHPAVADCAVIGQPDALYGETLAAVVNVRAGHDLTLEDLQDHCRTQLSGYKVPRRLSLRTIPRTATGKTDKVTLRRDLVPEHGADAAPGDR
jgi:acyl-CoA synthetase (AMP-forming)/AMP-acid ligase II